MRTGWRVTFTVANVAAETLVALTLAVSGLFVVLHSVHLAVLGELAGACLIAWSATADPTSSPQRRRFVLAALTVVLVVLAAVEVGLGPAVVVGLAWTSLLVRRIRAITAVYETEVQVGRLVWDAALLSAAWLYPVVSSQVRSGPRVWPWLVVFSLVTVVTRYVAMHAAQMQSTTLSVTGHSRSTAVGLVTLVGVVFGVLILAAILPQFRLVLIVALVGGILAFAVLLNWRSLIAGFVVVLMSFGFAYFLRAVLSGKTHTHFQSPPPPKGRPLHHPLPANPWYAHLPWGAIGLAAGLSVVVILLLRTRASRHQVQAEVESVQVERERITKRRRSARSLPPTPMRRVVARWLRQRERSYPIARGETLQAYVQRDDLPRLPELAHLAAAYDAERYASRAQPKADALRIEGALRKAGLWRT